MPDPRRIIRHMGGREVVYVRADLVDPRVEAAECAALDLGHQLVKERKAVEAERDRCRAAIERLLAGEWPYHHAAIREAVRDLTAALHPTTDAQEGK